jgi:UDP-N-acetylglucosamine 2-epimerase (non-hydrolysing)
MGHRILLLTAHRKESLDGGLQNIFSSIKKALHDYPNLHVIYVSHPNPVIQKIVKEAKLDTVPNLSILSPLSYLDMVYLLSTADVVATDSGGIQEEAVSLGKPVLVLRNETDRPEALLAGAVLVGTNQTSILREIGRYMESNLAHSKNQTVYGDGHSGERIALTIKNILNQKGLQ